MRSHQLRCSIILLEPASLVELVAMFEGKARHVPVHDRLDSHATEDGRALLLAAFPWRCGRTYLAQQVLQLHELVQFRLPGVFDLRA